MSDIQLRHGQPTSPASALSSSLRAATSASSSRRSASAADAVVADLEDAVAPGEKAAARGLVHDVFAAAVDGRAAPARPRQRRSDTAFHADDMAAVAAIAPDAIVLPKATPDAVDALGAGRPARRRHRRDGAGCPARLRDRVAPAGRRAADRRGRPRRRGRARAEAGRARDPLCPLEGRARLGRGRAALAVRRRPRRRRGGRCARGGVPAGALARLPGQGVHPPVAGARREPRLHAERVRGRLGLEGARRLRGGRGDGPGRRARSTAR